MQDHFNDMNIMQDVLREAQTGLWVIEMDKDKAPRMYADSAMRELLGFDEIPEPENCYEFWYERIVDAYYPVVMNGVEKIINDQRTEVQYGWIHPKWGYIYVRCGGVRDWNYKDGVCLRGYHQNITNTVILRQEYDAVIQTLSQGYISILLCNLKDKSYRTIKMSEKYEKLAGGFSSYEHFFRFYVSNEVALQYRDSIMDIVENDTIARRISNGEKQIEIFFRNIYDRWQRIKLVPANGFSEEYPWVIVAFDEQDGELEKRLNDASAKAAVAQIYTLVISVDLERSEYNCICYSGCLLRLTEHGSYSGFYRQVLQRMPSEDRKELDLIFDRASYQTDTYREGMLRLLDNDGKLHYYSYYSAPIRQGIVERILLTIRNIDDKREAQLRDNALSNLCQCYYSIYMFDLENNTEEAIWQENEVKGKFPKGSLKDYYGKFVREYVCEQDREKMSRAGNPEFLRQTLSAENPVYDIDFRRIYPNRQEWVRSRFRSPEMRDGQVTKVIFANMNIHDQKMEELKLEEQNRNALMAAYETAKSANEAKSNFLAQMSHDIRTPMNAIIGMSAIAANSAEEPERVLDCLRKINTSSRHLLAIINEILDMSKIEKGRIELNESPFDLNDLFDGLGAMVRAQVAAKRQNLSFEVKNIVHDKLFGDASRIRQVILNLMSNAVKYTPEGGHIFVKAQEVSGHTAGYGSFVFTVEDDGIGMSEEFIDYIFVPFSRADDPRVQSVQGTGLGMPIAQGIVSAMQGNIQVESALARGSRFIVTLNLKIAEPDAVFSDRDNYSGDNGELSASCQRDKLLETETTLLLVEDNELNMEIAKTILQQAGYRVESAFDGLEALRFFSESAPNTFDAILMDLQMPVMDGCTSARRIRCCGHPQAQTIPIIALTANAFAEDVARALAAGMNDHISKPIDYKRLYDVLDKYING